MSSDTSQTPPKKRLKLRVFPAAERAIRNGHPWVYADSVKSANRDGETGEVGIVYDKKDRFLALVLFDADSPIALRVLHAGKPEQVTVDWWRSRLKKSIDARASLLSDQTNGIRLINGENDGWPALVVDQYSDVLVLKLYSAAWLSHLQLIQELLLELCAPRSIVLRLSRNMQDTARAEYGLKEGDVLHGDAINEAVVFSENGLKFEAEVLNGQKTGFFLDQRDNRQRIGRLAKGVDVLNAFSFSGGFSLHAAAGGARTVTDLDISEHAIASARRNFQLNHDNPRVVDCEHGGMQVDVFEWFKKPVKQTYDLIIVDPPSLARREKERHGALHAYHQLTAQAIKRLRKGGILLSCSCSAHVSKEEFFDVVRSAAKESGRSWKELETTTHPEDHPQLESFPEAAYLKGIYLSFSN